RCEDDVERTSVPQGWRLVRRTEGAAAPPALGGTSAAGAAAHAADEEAAEEELLALADAVQQADEESGELPNDPGPRLVRREDIPRHSGHPQARGHRPSRPPRRTLRAVQENA